MVHKLLLCQKQIPNFNLRSVQDIIIVYINHVEEKTFLGESMGYQLENISTTQPQIVKIASSFCQKTWILSVLSFSAGTLRVNINLIMKIVGVIGAWKDLKFITLDFFPQSFAERDELFWDEKKSGFLLNVTRT